MLLAPIVEGLEQDLKRAAAVGGDDTRRVADVLVEALGSAVRLRFLDALQQAADELTASLPARPWRFAYRERPGPLPASRPWGAPPPARTR